MIVLLIIVFICIILIDVPDLIEKKCRHELIIYSAFIGLAFILSICLITGIPIPSPVKASRYVVKNILHLNYK